VAKAVERVPDRRWALLALTAPAERVVLHHHGQSHAPEDSCSGFCADRTKAEKVALQCVATMKTKSTSAPPPARHRRRPQRLTNHNM
jgi:hypothetical protein